MPRTQARSAAAMIAVALLLAACTDDPEPKRADPTSDSPSTPPTTETSPPTSPPTDDPEPLSPEDTVRAWVESFNTLLTSGGGEEFRSLSTERCPQCAQLVESIGDMYAQGGSTRTKGWKIRNVASRPDFRTSGNVVASIDAARGVTISEAGAKPVVDQPDAFIIELSMRRLEGRWLVDELTFLS